ERARPLTAVGHRLRFDAAIRSAWQALAAVHAQADALLCPTMSRLQPPADGEEPPGGLDMTGIFNLTSPCPALSVPCGWSSRGLPTGWQIGARRHGDEVARRIGAALERLQPWAERRPLV